MVRTGQKALAPAGSTGNNTHPSVSIDPASDVVTVEFEVTAVGATPTVTYNVQASNDNGDVSDAASDWFDPFALRENAATEADIAGTKTAVSLETWTLDLTRRPFQKLRLVTSANTNVTYEATVFEYNDK